MLPSLLMLSFMRIKKTTEGHPEIATMVAVLSRNVSQELLPYPLQAPAIPTDTKSRQLPGHTALNLQQTPTAAAFIHETTAKYES